MKKYLNWLLIAAMVSVSLYLLMEVKSCVESIGSFVCDDLDLCRKPFG